MEQNAGDNNFSNVLIIGAGRMPSSIAVCLAASGCDVTLVSQDPPGDQIRINQHITDLRNNRGYETGTEVQVTSEWVNPDGYDLALISGYSDEAQIHETMSKLESTRANDLIIAVATDHLELQSLQNERAYPGQILTLNWSEPAHTTFFLEIVHNAQTDPEIVDRIKGVARRHWGKDPYVVKAELGARGRMAAAMVREAMYLVEEGYAHIEDIDRACRNDAGTYLPFAGNFQYMDLMGTYAYGVVMQKLNQELSNATFPSPSFEHFSNSQGSGNGTGRGVYNYSEEDRDKWESRMRTFSFEIRALMEKYPFGFEGGKERSG